MNGLRLVMKHAYNLPSGLFEPQTILSDLTPRERYERRGELAIGTEGNEATSVAPSRATASRPSPRRIRIGISAPRKARVTLAQGPQEAAKNIRILSGLERAYGLDKARSVLEQATSIFHVVNPHVENSPELYELFENGQIDQALEYFGTSWVIGRVKLD